jgi:hypothetical protein
MFTLTRKQSLHKWCASMLQWPACTELCEAVSSSFIGITIADRTNMTYRAYSGPHGSDNIAPLEKDRLLYKEFETLDAALGWARHVNDGGRVALLIEGDDGTRLGRNEIASTLHHREAPPR